VIEASRKGVARGRSNGALGELLQATAYANLYLAGQENTEKLSLWAGNMRSKMPIILSELILCFCTQNNR